MPPNPSQQPKPINSRLGPLPEDALDEEVVFNPGLDRTLSPDMQKWIEERAKLEPEK